MSALDERQLQEIATQEYELNKLRAESRKLKPMPLTVQPKEGYYISGEDYSKYKSQALEYNKNLLQYKRDLNQSYKDVIANRTSLRDYERLSRSYISALKQQAPQRLEQRQRVQEIALTGPPEPTLQQRQRAEAGMPQVGLPGPSQARPGSISAQLQPIASEALQLSEKPFELVTDPIRTADRYLEKLSYDAQRTDRALQLEQGYGTKRDYSIEQAVMVESEQRPLVGTGAYLGSVGFGVVATGIDVATFEVRPGLWAKTAGGVAGLVFDPEARTAVIDTVVADPFRFVSTIIGGAKLGQAIQKFDLDSFLNPPPPKPIKISNWIPNDTPILDRVRGFRDRLVSKKLRYLSKREFDKLVNAEESFTQFERELNLDFPEETVESTTVRALFKRGELKILDDLGIPRKKIPFYLETAPEVEKMIADAVPDEFALEQINSKIDSYYALPFDETGGSILVKGRSGMKPFSIPTVTEPSVIDGSIKIAGDGTVTVAKKAGKTTSALTDVSKSSYFETVMETERITYIPAVDLMDTLAKSAKASSSGFFPSISISTGLSVKNLAMLDTQVKDATKDLFLSLVTLETLLKPIAVQESGAIQIPRLTEFQTTKPVSTQIPKMGPTQKPVSITALLQTPIPITTQIQTPIQKPISIQIPRIIFSPFVFPKIESVKPPIMFRLPKKKKKKKKTIDKRKKKGVYELRVDKIVKGLLKL